MTATCIGTYWGKALPRAGADVRWHPLAYHGLDVAAAGEALLAARPHVLEAIARISGLPADIARSWLIFGLALHDLGKYADCFQAKAEEHWAARGMFSPAADPGHGSLGRALWENDLRLSRGRGRPHTAALFAPTDAGDHASTAFDHWLTAIFGHHGRPVGVPKYPVEKYMTRTACDDARAYVAACARLFDPTVPVDFLPPDDYAMKRSAWLVAGFAMVADWIGSNEDWFPYEPPVRDLDAYWTLAQERARRAVSASGLATAGMSATFGLADALPREPDVSGTPLQQWAAEGAPLTGQSLVIMEDLTGSGKTEAALIAAHRLMWAGAAEGLYWALPTMATADALYDRVSHVYRALFAEPDRASLVLAHSARADNSVFRKSVVLAETAPRADGPFGPDDEDRTASVRCARWIADDRRRTFLADIGVGTIDQAVLGVLPSKHQALRLLGLARRVLVIDEVHSLDAYQDALVESLLTFHAALGGSAVLLSATLTTTKRQRLMQAFASGANWAKPTARDPRFPLASVLDAAGLTETACAASRGTRRDLAVVRLDGPDPALDVLAQANSDGRAAVWIRNTVQDVLDGAAMLRARLPHADVGVFHARFALGDRLRIQDDVLTSFGKASAGPARHRILVASQVVEQSLDADWDVMVTDLAPIDLVIQRAGRLHRHDRGERTAPVLHVVGPPATDDATAGWYEAAFPRAAFVYPNHGELWLTMHALVRSGLPLATGNPRDLLEQVYGPASAFPTSLDKLTGKAYAAETSRRQTGRLNALKLNDGYGQEAMWQSDTRTPTRLGDEQRVLRLARWQDGRLTPWIGIEGGDVHKAWRLSEVSVRAYRVADVVTDDAALKRAAKAVVATWPEAYDPPLLVPLVAHGDGIGDVWGATVIGADDTARAIRYASDRGLWFEAP
jgi:CRISPR-associated endonuclease/helicase Cas3